MKALTICQPYASLIINPPHLKRVENRSWQTNYRGPIAIHAGVNREWLSTWHAERPDPMPFGYVIGTADLVAIVAAGGLATRRLPPQLEWLRTHEHCEGPWLWVLANIRRFREPVACQGKQGLWDWQPPWAAGVKGAGHG